MCQGDCCNEFASNPQVQLLYVVVSIIYALATFGVAILLIIEEGNTLVLEWVIAIVGLLVLVTWIIMLSSRCCAPCCCRAQMPDVPQPCPPGECSCQNVALLDYPFHIAVIGDIVTTLVLNLLESVMDHAVGGLETLKGLRLVVIAWAILVCVSACTGFRKFVLLNEQRAMRPAPPHPGAMVVGAPGGQQAVVGTPVQVPGKIVA
mmetsp:Transcript_35506/g.57127  ORF Transcript_35506/g.57127 Transcript_35506/m.57127 type:complete len:205 (+) Transcript_35506:52-666(+)